MITFAEHQVRAGKDGAPRDFEQMLGLLVRATSCKDASLVFANPGDWGIDVLAGSLNERVTVWQAKYFAQGIGRSQRTQVESSFATVVAKAKEHGFTLERWVLCAPASMDTRTRQWWEGWKETKERATGVAIDLWDENVLRELLLTREAAAVYEEYYGTRPTLAPRGPGDAGAAEGPAAVGQVTATATAGGDAYAAGGDLHVAGRDINVHEGVGTKRLLLAVSGVVGVIVLVTAGTLLFFAHDARGADSTKTPPLSVYAHSAVRPPQAWAAQVNAVCRQKNPRLVADLNRIESFPQSDYGSLFSPMNPAIPRAYNQLYSDYSNTDALLQNVPEPSVQNAAVNDWLTAWANRNATLYKAANDMNGVNSDPFDRVTSLIEVNKFVSETESMHPLAIQVGVPECV
ncbi:MAG TPA: hypothetical protein VN969_07100 [Streptosporangiaceae bacterium]|nr:hypothetical protein [Streptosporangiaceae bacterium]